MGELTSERYLRMVRITNKIHDKTDEVIERVGKAIEVTKEVVGLIGLAYLTVPLFLVFGWRKR